ncbi:DUF4179 domain-containing protein [Paenibacillus massiliensis]|uniref:DUF4179 domain-containing protein n=1 Tax=Paenibacillus massiliensis TaxID=225917 RepID=UPI000429ED95|nr:DUF5643 domain-containing protein [Paenibacillus massiliensis]
MSKSNHEYPSNSALSSLKELECPPELTERIWLNTLAHVDSTDITQHQAAEVRKKAGYKRNIWRGMLVTTSAAASLLLMLILASLFSPSFAHALSKLPVVGGLLAVMDHLGVQTADEQGRLTEPEVSDTHDGITLRVPQVAYDGRVLMFTVMREPQYDVDTSNRQSSSGISTAGNTDVVSSLQTDIEHYSWMVNGESPDAPGLTASTGADPNGVLFKTHNYTRAHQYSQNMPEEFELTVQIRLKGVDKPYTLKFPVKNNMDHYEHTLNIVKETSEVTLTLQKITFTPLSTSYNLMLQHHAPESREKYRQFMLDIQDDQGRRLDWISAFGDFEDDRHMQEYYLLLYDRFQAPPAYIVIKPFLTVMQEPYTNSGPFARDANGDIKKMYLKELEMIIPIDSDQLQGLYDNKEASE